MANLSNFLKDAFYKIGIYKQAKLILTTPYIMLSSFRFKVHANEAIKNFLQTMNYFGYSYWLEYGTLLGAIRENRLISYDCDIDVAMLADDWDEKIEERLKLHHFHIIKRARLMTGEIIEETYMYKSTQIDIFYAYKDGDKINIYEYETFDGLSPRQCIREYGGLKVHVNRYSAFNLIDYSFFDTTVKVPDNYDLHLRELYGDDYMIPMKNWKVSPYEIRREMDGLAQVEYF